ncbi:MAG: histidine kinase [Sphingomonadales bacterium]|nr:histidine kinase [Sphingomonadales bacterium]
MIQMLALLDLPAIGARSIATGIAQLNQNPDVALLICDLRLPGENGADIRARIAGAAGLEDRVFTIIFMSGDTERAEAMAVEPGNIILTKPIEPSVLIDTIFACLDLDLDVGATTGKKLRQTRCR